MKESKIIKGKPEDQQEGQGGDRKTVADAEEELATSKLAAATSFFAAAF